MYYIIHKRIGVVFLLPLILPSTQAASESRDDVVDSLLDKTKSREIVVRRTTTFDSGDGTKVEAPRSPQHHGAFKSADIQPFEGDGVG